VIVASQEKRPIPLDAVRREFSDFLRGQGVDPETVEFDVEHQKYIGTFGGEVKTITITVLTLPDGSVYQWFPELPDGIRNRREA
jgi:hypothetical protein